MQRFVESKFYNIVLILILSLCLIFVIILGTMKQKNENNKWITVLDKMEVNKKPNSTDSASNPIQTNGEVSSSEQVNKNDTLDIYKGAKSIGSSDNNRWKNKKWYAAGDNITAGNGYQNKVKAAASMNSVTTDAAVGKVMADIANSITTDKLKDIDLVTVFAGTADYSLDTPLGTINDNENSNTFYGNVHKTIKNIIDSNPNASVVFFTPLKRGAYKTYPVYPKANNAGVKLEDYVKAIKDVCKSYNILVFDLFAESGINENNLKSYSTDNLNLNNAGYQRISTLIAGYLKTIK